MYEIGAFRWVLTTLSDVPEKNEMDETTYVVVKFDVPMYDGDAPGVRIRTVSGYITEFVRVQSGKSVFIRFAVDGEVFRARADFPVYVWVEAI